MNAAPRTLFDKLWDAHVVVPESDTAPAVLEPDQVAGLGEVDVALVHSAKGAQALAAVLAVHPQPRLKVLGLSKAVLAPLAKVGSAGLASPPFPLEAAMLNLLDRG